MIGSQDYHIALIPLQHLIKELALDAPSPARSNPVFILPLTWKDLVGHLRAEVVHPKSNQTNDVFGFGAIRVKLSSMEVHRSGRPVTLTRLQFKLLQYFILNPTKVISRDELLNEVWGLNNYPCTRTVDTHVHKLRQQLEADPASPVHFHTVHAAGYKFIPYDFLAISKNCQINDIRVKHSKDGASLANKELTSSNLSFPRQR